MIVDLQPVRPVDRAGADEIGGEAGEEKYRQEYGAVDACSFLIADEEEGSSGGGEVEGGLEDVGVDFGDLVGRMMGIG